MKNLTRLIGVCTAAAFLVASPVSAKTVLRIASTSALDMPADHGLQYFAKIVGERTNGEIEIQPFPNSQLGSEQHILEGVLLGNIDMFEGSTGGLGRFLADLDALTCPFLWDSNEHILKVVRGKIGKDLSDRLLKSRGIRVLDMGWLFGRRELTTRGRAVRTPADMKGLKIRVQPNPIYMATIRTMGGSPTPMAIKEVYTALETGVIDGQENPANNIVKRSFHEVQDYVSLTGHIVQSQAVVINESVFQGLTSEQQKIISEAVIEAGNYQNGLVDKSRAEALKTIEAGGTKLIEPDVAAFQEATRDACRDPKILEKWSEGFLDKLLAARDAARQ